MLIHNMSAHDCAACVVSPQRLERQRIRDKNSEKDTRSKKKLRSSIITWWNRVVSSRIDRHTQTDTPGTQFSWIGWTTKSEEEKEREELIKMRDGVGISVVANACTI